MTPPLTEKQKKLCTALFDIGAVCFGSFKFKLHERLPDAPLSPDYINLRNLPRYPEVKKMALEVYLELLAPLEFDLLSGIPLAATPLASSLSDRLNIGMVTPRITDKTHGNGVKADGYSEKDNGRVVAVIDDLITGADSKFEAIAILERLGLMVRDVIVLVDREQGGTEELKRKGYFLHAGMKRSQMLEHYMNTKKITLSTYKDIIYRTNRLNMYLKASIV